MASIADYKPNKTNTKKPTLIEDFANLREFTLATSLSPQALVEILVNGLRKALKDKGKRPYYILCAIQMLIDHGKPGFLEAIVSKLSRQQQGETLRLNDTEIAIETRLEVARFVKAGFRYF